MLQYEAKDLFPIHTETLGGERNPSHSDPGKPAEEALMVKILNFGCPSHTSPRA